ncbi:MAG: hypothetical protein NC082_04385 [Clostridiales bacterium]|nr:hypothetical protein [Clostridiales bacterium]
MKVSKEYYDEQYDFKGQWDMPSRCGLKIRDVDGIPVIIVTELYQENPGTSVTYAGESLMRQICESKGLDPNIVRYIECTPDTNSKLSFYDEEFYEVDFAADDPTKKYHMLSQAEVEKIKTVS